MNVKPEGDRPSRVGLEHHGIVETGPVFWNLSPTVLYEHALSAGEGYLAANGSLLCATGVYTGRSPGDKFIVDEPSSRGSIEWGPVNRPLSTAHFDGLHRRITQHFRGRKLYVRDMFAGADEASRLPIRIVTESAWHNLFAAQLFIRPGPGATADRPLQFTVLHAPTCQAEPKTDGVSSGAFVVIHFGKKLVLIGGTGYAGEIKKAVFTVMNYLLPQDGVLSMHCSANLGRRGDVALFFGLSGTGKTTLSADPDRRLIGDDEHGWSDHGVFNIEGGCYAKCIGLSRANEPQIFQAIRFGAVLENVSFDHATRDVDYDSDALTENTRAAYPIEHIPDAVIPGVGEHPRNVVFLTCDAFGVLPPISLLSPEQAMYHFLSGYTAKVAGTERGVTEPSATFSTCFGAPFLPLPPQRYATMLRDRLAAHRSRCWLVNTGWTGGGVGLGRRISLRHTRALVKAALSGRLDGVSYQEEAVFGLAIPQTCPDVPVQLLTPRNAWKDPSLYDAKATELAALFSENAKTFRGIPVAAAGAAASL